MVAEVGEAVVDGADARVKALELPEDPGGGRCMLLRTAERATLWGSVGWAAWMTFCIGTTS